VLSLLACLAILLPAAPSGAVAQTTTGAVASSVPPGVYRDPAGRFTVPIPTNWTAEERHGYVVLADPDSQITISAVVVDGTDAKAGIAAAWAIADPSFDPNDQPGAIEQEVPSSPGVETTLVITYDVGHVSGKVIQAAGQVAAGRVYVLIFEGTLDAATKRASQIRIVSTGFTITGTVETDLTGVAPKRFGGALLTEFASYVKDLMARSNVPGAEVAVVQDGKIVYANGYGVKKIGGTDPVSPDTLMMIGSTTKSMTTMMMATEVDGGLMRWDEPVVDVLPSFAVADPALTKKITVRNLVCACTGVPRRDMELAFNANGLTPEDVIASLQGFQFSTKIGEAFQYSNQMVATGGYVAAAAAGGRYGQLGQAYATQLRRRVLDPIGMKRTTLSIAQAAADGDHATPHGLRLDDVYLPLSPAVESIAVPIAPAAAIWSSANEMGRYLLTELNRGVAPDGTRVVSAANLEETWQPQVAVDAETSYGLGWFVGKYKGLKLIDHGGNSYGFTSDLAFLPDERIGIVVLANAQQSNLFTEGVRYRLFELLFGQPEENDKQIVYAEDQIAQAKTRVEQLVAARADPGAVAGYLHRYHNDLLGDVTIALVQGRLYLDAGEFRVELRPLKQQPSIYVVFDPPLAVANVTGEFRRNAEDGRPEFAIRVGTDQYVFALVATGAPRASPPATPMS
jgi:CubicO group peptidase (beta-lactamase class C family)